MTLKIAIDASSAAAPQKAGVARYIEHLIANLEEIDEENEYVVCYRLSRIKKRRYFYKPKKRSTRIKVFQEPFFKGRGIDVFHGPDARLPRIKGPRLIATIHDVFSLIPDDYAGETFRKTMIARYSDIAARADRIICDSLSTRNDFIRFFPDAESRACVLYPGVDKIFHPRSEEEVCVVKKKYRISSDYIFYVGELSRRKNVLRMMGAFRRARERLGTDIQFVLAGTLAYRHREIHHYLEEHHCEDRILLPGYVPDRDLPSLYSGARLFLFTTLYEGFGLPILEALACGTPVITSNVSSMKEIAPEVTTRVDPQSEEDIAQAIVKLLCRPPSKTEEAERIRAASKYTWAETATQVLATCYRSSGREP